MAKEESQTVEKEYRGTGKLTAEKTRSHKGILLTAPIIVNEDTYISNLIRFLAKT